MISDLLSGYTTVEYILPRAPLSPPVFMFVVRSIHLLRHAMRENTGLIHYSIAIFRTLKGVRIVAYRLTLFDVDTYMIETEPLKMHRWTHA